MIVTFVRTYEIKAEQSNLEWWHTCIDGVHVKNSLSYDKSEARTFHDALVKNGGIIEGKEILQTTTVEDKR